MRHVSITCKNHPELRWACKDIAWGSSGYNGMRGIFFKGRYLGKFYFDNSGADCSEFNEDYSRVPECQCHGNDLVLAPEDAELKAIYVARWETPQTQEV